ncbi:hypothetical protein FRC01_003577 [Tulasnella sp. 417]|nr:hypothetical protein FRC01_003577 [Tulasnella sp. 417]
MGSKTEALYDPLISTRPDGKVVNGAEILSQAALFSSMNVRRFDKELLSLGGEALEAMAKKGTRAPMPSVVVEVKANAGDRVKMVQVAVVLESMKTETVLRAERNDVVLSVGCK